MQTMRAAEQVRRLSSPGRGAPEQESSTKSVSTPPGSVLIQSTVSLKRLADRSNMDWPGSVTWRQGDGG